jgi:hypothetical protein
MQRVEMAEKEQQQPAGQQLAKARDQVVVLQEAEEQQPAATAMREQQQPAGQQLAKARDQVVVLQEAEEQLPPNSATRHTIIGKETLSDYSHIFCCISLIKISILFLSFLRIASLDMHQTCVWIKVCHKIHSKGHTWRLETNSGDF